MEIVVSLAFFGSFVTFVFCVASLRSHVDEAKVRDEGNVSSLFRSSIPPERVLTATGLRRVKIAKIALAVIVALTVGIVISRNIR